MTKNTFLALAFIFSMTVFSQEIVTDRPDQTESSFTVGKKNIQIESGILFQNNRDTSIQSIYGPSTLIRYGISKGFELRMMLQYESTKNNLEEGNRKLSGFNDVEIGVKLHIINTENVNTKIAFLTHFLIPTANENISTNNFGVINKFAISHIISNAIGVGYNIGFDYVEKQSAFTYSLAMGIAISDKLGFYLEPYGNWGESNNFDSNLDTGFTYKINRNFQLDVSYGLGLNNEMYYISTGFSWKIPDN